LFTLLYEIFYDTYQYRRSIKNFDTILIQKKQMLNQIQCLFVQLLAKEQEVEEKSHHLKIATAEIECLKTEVSRLRRYEDELNNVQVSE